MINDMSAQSGKGENKGVTERRSSERRSVQRRKSASEGSYKGSDRRKKSSDRRTTIFNRLKKEVTDRRSLN
ncbi:MAG: hypothetical protein V1874_13020 [Spirochaetota bacterium]